MVQSVSYVTHFRDCWELAEPDTSDVMKFHHFGHQLLETNCLLLILKMFGLQEVTQTVVSKADSPDNKYFTRHSFGIIVDRVFTSFFRYCLLNYSRNPQPMRPEENMPRPPRVTQKRMITLPNGTKHEEEVEQVTDYSWRNFFATINFAKIMQKLSKGRSHRIWMLVQYKSSVRPLLIIASSLLPFFAVSVWEYNHPMEPSIRLCQKKFLISGILRSLTCPLFHLLACDGVLLT